MAEPFFHEVAVPFFCLKEGNESEILYLAKFKTEISLKSRSSEPSDRKSISIVLKRPQIPILQISCDKNHLAEYRPLRKKVI
jgi:hypothetical protein